MNKHPIENYPKRLAESARLLLSATSDAAEDSVKQARQQLETVLQSGKSTLTHAKEQTAESLEAVDGAMRNNPYAFAGIAFALGVLTACAVGRGSK